MEPYIENLSIKADLLQKLDILHYSNELGSCEKNNNEYKNWSLSNYLATLFFVFLG